MSESIRVEVAYVDPQRQLLRTVHVSAGASARDAIIASGTDRDAQLDVEHVRVGIFSREITLDTILHDGDRVEIYRPLIIDPKEARRKRAKAKR